MQQIAGSTPDSISGGPTVNIRKTILSAAIIGFVMISALAGCSKKDEKASDSSSQAPASVAQAPSNTSLVNDLQARLKEKPNDPDILWKLADAYFEAHQYDQAAVYYKKTLNLKPNEADVYNDAGLSLHYSKQSDEALKYVEEGIKRNPYHQRIWLTKGFILAYGKGDLEGAKAAWEKANALNPESQVGKAAADFLAQFNKK